MVGMSLLYIPLCILAAMLIVGPVGALYVAGVAILSFGALHIIAVWFNGPPPGGKK